MPREPLKFSLTQMLVGLNLLVFAAFVVSHGTASLIRPDSMEMVKWGSSYGPRVLTGEPWRLFTSNFLHFGLLHLLCNMIVLGLVCPQVERFYGFWRTALIFSLSGLASGCFSLLLVPISSGAGSSGAIFGLVGSALSFSILQKWEVVRPSLTRWGLIGLGLAVTSFVAGIVSGAADRGALACHVGGLFSGFLLGFFCLRTTSAYSRLERIVSWAWLTALFLMLFFVVGWAPLDLRGNYKLALALRRFEDGCAADALSLSEQFLKLNPNNQLGLIYRGRFFIDLHEEEKACLDFDEALRLGADFVDVLPYRINAEFELGRYRQVIADADRIMQTSAKESTKANALYHKGLAHLALNLYDLAGQDAKALARLGEKSDSDFLRALSLRRQGQLTAALSVAEARLQAYPDDKGAQSQYYSLMAECGRREEALKLIALRAQSETIPNSLVSLAMHCLALGDYAQAKRLSDKVLSENKNWQLSQVDYALIIKALALRCQHDQAGLKALKEMADKQLQDPSLKLTRKDWPCPVFLYLVAGDAAKQDQLLLIARQKARNMSRLTEFNFYLAVKYVADASLAANTAERDKLLAEADQLLNDVIENGNITYMEYDCARVLQKSLKTN